MKKLRLCLLTGSLLLMSVFVFAGSTFGEVQAVFKKMYPKVVNAEWDRKSNYHIADFMMNGHEMNVWFDVQAQWIMTETDVESLKTIPAPVAEAFMKSALTSMRVEDIRIITFPKQPTVIVIEVDEYNSDKEFQLFYAPDGTLLQTLDVSDTGGEIYPGLFE